MFDEDDDYYDEDEEFEEGSGVGRIVLVVVLVVGLFVVAVLAAVIVLLSTDSGKAMVRRLVDPPAVTTPAQPDPKPAEGAESTPVPPSTASDDGFGPMDGTDYEGQKSQSLERNQQLSPEDSGGRSDDVSDMSGREDRRTGQASDRTPRSRPEPAEPRRSRSSTSDRGWSSDSSSRSSSSDSDRRSSRDGSGSDEGLVIRSGSSTSSSGRSSSSSDRAVASSSRSSAGSSRRSGSVESRSSSDSEPRVLDASNSSSSSASPKEEVDRGPVADLDKESIASMAARARMGRLTREELRDLRSLPSTHSQYTLAWATAMKHAEVKKDYKGHCEASRKIVQLSRNKYHPEWNLEYAKCQMRNGELEAAIRSIDRTLADSMSMTSSTKMQRLLLAYEIKARSRTKLYDDNAKANSGLGDEIKLSAALDAWTGFRNYAAGIGDQQALRKADREIADLAARR